MASSYSHTSTHLAWSALSDFSNVDKPVRAHLVDVYRTLAIALGSASVGVYADFTGFTATYLPLFNGGGFVSMLASMGLMMWLMSEPAVPGNMLKREGILYLFALLQGLSIGTLVTLVYYIDPAIVFTALSGTTLIFACFTASALLARDRTYLLLGGFLGSALSLLFWTSLLNMFFRSDAVLSLQLYVGLAVFSGFVLYDTQLIVAKARAGMRDYVWQAIELFTDFLGIFTRLLVILTRRNASANEDERRRRRQ